MYICSKCFDVVGWKCHKCKGTHHEDCFPIDSQIALAISILNKKGYKTKYCCEGHASEDTNEAYIYFENPINSHPKDFHIDPNDSYTIRVDREKLKWNNLNFMERNLIVSELNNNILDWALNLDPLTTENMYSIEELDSYYCKLVDKIFKISDEIGMDPKEMYNRFYVNIRTRKSKIYKYFKDAEDILELGILTGAFITIKNHITILDEKCYVINRTLNFKLPYNFYSDINELN